jgi:hypothetical protein
MSRCTVVGDALAAFCATMLANRVLEAEIERLSEAVSAGFEPALPHTCRARPFSVSQNEGRQEPAL